MTDHRMTFSAPMVRALLREIEAPGNGKTQTRRPIKRSNSEFDDGPWPKHLLDCEFDWHAAWVDPGFGDGPYLHLPWPAEETTHRIYPRWSVGDRIAVRENFIGPYAYEINKYPPRDWGNKAIWFPADGPVPEKVANQFWHSARPSIHMPSWASRIALVVTDVRPERVQDISKNAKCRGSADAVAEGLSTVTKDGTLWKWGIPDRDGLPGNDDFGWPWQDWEANPCNAFRTLWNSIYGPGAWDRNDWVWAITFQPHLCNIDQLEPTNG